MKRTAVLITFFLLITLSLSAQDTDKKFSGWKQAETDHFKFVFEESARETVEEFAKIADDAWNKIAGVYSLPQDKTRVYVTDRTGTVNAYTYFSPIEIMMFTTPNLLNEFGFREEWKKLFFTHELIHVANANFEDKLYIGSKLFGSYGRSFDLSLHYPAWALEGLTTVLETELTDGGRGRSPYFELMYKAPTLDNSFISYDEIGQELEPPNGQGYVMGYLISRSIADRWGVSALADIERNRSIFLSYEESVYKVTGETAENIYKDVKIALAKKYATERLIPEGQILSSRNNKSYTYKPAIIMDDGTIIALRSNTQSSVAVVSLNPSANSGSNYIEDSRPGRDLNTLLEETILFEGAFSNENSVTADKNGTVYASLACFRNDRFPGQEYEFPIYKWTKESKLKKITKGVSLYMPSVSRDGSTLVAMKQNGLHFMLVEVDTETGETTELLFDDRYDFLQPSVNDDGTKIAFLRSDGKRAAVCVCDISNPANYEIVANGDGDIVDPSYPSWNSDGKLLYGCNTRGRLEIFEVSENVTNQANKEADFVDEKTNDEADTNQLDDEEDSSNDNELTGKTSRFVSTPVLADPIGALWAYKTERGIYYYSYSSNGYVIKIKPESEWGVVPEEFGPSPAGEVISFGALENDYPDFEPYPKYAKRVRTGNNETDENEKISSKNKNSDSPIPVRDIKIKEREEKYVEKVQNLPEPKTELSNEKTFVALPSPILYFPFIGFINDKKRDDTYLGFGAILLYTMPKVQLSDGFGILNASYYPELNNFTLLSTDFFPIGPMQFEIILDRSLSNSVYDDSENSFFEENSALVGATIPLLNRAESNISKNFSLLAMGNFSTVRFDKDIISLISPIDYRLQVFGEAGAEFTISKLVKKSNYVIFDAMALGCGMWLPNANNFFAGGESIIEIGYKTNFAKIELNFVGRYFDLPYGTSLPFSQVKYAAKSISFTYPGRIVGEARLSSPFLLPGLNLFVAVQKLLSFGTSAFENNNTPENGTFLNAKLDETTFLATGLSIGEGNYRFEAGIYWLFNSDHLFDGYISFKTKWLGF